MIPKILVLLLLCGVLVSCFRPQRLSSSTENNVNDVLVDLRSVYRLPNDTAPIRYNLFLETNIHLGQFDFRGENVIFFQVLQPTYQVVINSYQLIVDSVELRRGTELLPSTFLLQDRFLVVNSASQLSSGDDYLLITQFRGVHASPSEGFHYARYLYGGLPRYLASTQFQSVFAREAFPGYDEPQFRVPMTLTMGHGPEYNALFLTEPVSSSSGLTTFQESHSTPSYLFAFVVSDFVCSAKIGVQRICAQPNRFDEIDLAREASDLILRWMETYFDEPFDKDKLDHIAIPDFDFGGMENWGLIVYHPAFLLFREGESTVNDKINVASVISHELAHMFFGNLITPKWWTYLWLSEGLATFYEFYATHPSYPELRLDELFVIDALHRILPGDSTGFSRPMTYYVESPEAIESIFDGVAYLKAGSIFRMIMNAVTEPTFQKALRFYLNDNRNSAVDEKPLYAAIERAIAEDQTAPLNFIDRVMDSWTLQGGYPVITVMRNYETSTMEVSQEEFISSGSTGNPNKLWYVPLSYTNRMSPNFVNTAPHVWLTETSQPISSGSFGSSDWVIFNVQQTGYYRVNYDVTNWNLLIDELVNGNHLIFSPINRAQMIDDSNILARSNRLSTQIPLDLMAYLVHEADMIPLLAANRHFMFLGKMLADSTKYNLYQKFVSKLIANKLTLVKDHDVNESVDDFKLRSVLVDLTCELGLSECHELIRSSVNSELFEQKSVLNKEDRPKYYCHSLKTGDDALYEAYWSKVNDLLRRSSNKEEESESLDLLRQVACASNLSKVTDVLDSSLLQSKYRFEVLQSLAKNGHMELLLDYLVNNLPLIRFEEEKDDKFKTLLITMSDNILTGDQRMAFEELTILLESSGFTMPKTVPFNVQSNLDWLNSQRFEVESWLTENFE